MNYATVNGADLAYEVRGDGAPLIFVHGFLGDGTGPFYEEIKASLARDHRVYAIDMRSHGRSAAARDNVNLTQCACDITAFAETQDLKDVLVIGHSMGGFLTMAAAIHDPTRLRALVLMTPAASKGSPSDDVVDEFMAARTDRARMRDRFRPMFVHPVSDAQIEQLCDSALCLTDEMASHWVRNVWPNSDITSSLPTISLPVLSIIGTRDTVVSPLRQFQDASLIPNAKLVALMGEGHELPIERPELCMREINRFLQDLS